MKLMLKAIQVVVVTLATTAPDVALSGGGAPTCAIAKTHVEHLRSAQRAFLAAPSKQTAAKFIALMPANFCQFNAIYGFHPERGPLYGESLLDVLPRLDTYVEEKLLLSLYVSYAVDAEWDADNVNFMQRAYQNAVAGAPLLFVQAVKAFPKERRLNALRFLFDGPHPIKHGQLYEAVAHGVCAIDKSTCSELEAAWLHLLENRTH